MREGGEPDMVGLLLGSRELLCLSSRISRILVSCNSLSELYLPGESVICQIQRESTGWCSNIILSPRKPGGVFRGSRNVTSTSCHSGARHVKSTAYRYRGSTRPVVATWQGFDPSRRCRLPGYSVLSVVVRRQVFTFADSSRCSYSAERMYDAYSTHTLFTREYVLIHTIYSLHLYNMRVHTHT